MKVGDHGRADAWCDWHPRPLPTLSHRNWIQEKPLGRMVALSVGEQFSREHEKFADEIDRYRKSIDKTADLFSRIRVRSKPRKS